MKLNAVNLPAATYSESPKLKLTLIEYDQSDDNEVVRSGIGIGTVSVTGRTSTSTEAESIKAECLVDAAAKLYFPSARGESDDVYYDCWTTPAICTPVDHNADVYDYSFECLVADWTRHETPEE